LIGNKDKRVNKQDVKCTYKDNWHLHSLAPSVSGEMKDRQWVVVVVVVIVVAVAVAVVLPLPFSS